MSASRKKLAIIATMVWFVWLASSMDQAVVAKTLGNVEVIGDVEIKQYPLLSSVRNLHGYTEYRFVLKNLSTTQSHHVRLTIEGSSQRNHHVREISRSVVVGVGGRAEVPLFVPALSLSASRVYITVDYGRSSGSIALQHGYRYNYHNNLEISLLADPKAGVNSLLCDTFLRNNATVNIGKKTYQQHRYECKAADLPMPEWSDSWLGYGRFDGVLVTAQEWSRIPTPVRDALQHYVGQGGVLAILGPLTPLSHWIATQTVSASPSIYSLGFGRILLFPHAVTISDLTADQAQQLADVVHQSQQPWTNLMDTAAANATFPVVKDVKVPTRGIFVLMLLFCILVGPLNLRWLRQKQNRILMLVTVPAMAFLTCGLVFGYAMLSEGWTGSIRSSSVTLLDQRTHQAYTVGWHAYYFPLLPRDGLRFSYDTEITPQIKTVMWRQAGRGVSLHWDHEQHLSSGWLVSRLPTHFVFRQPQTRRERLLIHNRPNSHIEITNGLGATVRNLWVVDTQGKVYRSNTKLEAGGKQTLAQTTASAIVPVDNESPKQSQALRTFYSKSWLELREKLVADPQKFLRRGTYIAEMESLPFVDAGSKQSASRRHHAVVMGIWGEPANGN